MTTPTDALAAVLARLAAAGPGTPEAAAAFPGLAAAARRLAEAHQPAPVHRIAKYAAGPRLRNGMLYCGHPESALIADGRHKLNDDQEWVCLDQVDYMACTGCDPGESGDESDFASCQVAQILGEELGQLVAW